MQEEIPPAPEERSEPEEPEQPLVNGTVDETGHTTPTKPKGVSEQPNSPDLDHASEVNDNPNAEPTAQDPTSSKVGDQDTDNVNPNLLLSNSKTEAAQQSLWFETQLNSTEMDFLQKLLPKGYSLTTQFRASRARAARNVDPSQTIDFKDDPLPKRPPRIHSNRFRPAEISYGPPKYSKNVSDLVKKCFKVLSQLQKHQYSRPFLKPVDPDAEGIPDYFDIVKEPMDLSKVDKRLRSGSYVNPMQFAADVRKIWSNAILYNPRKSAIYRMTVQISDFFEQIYKPVEENPFAEPQNEYLLSRVLKIEQKLDEIKNGYSNPEEYLNRPMRLDDKLKLAKALKNLDPESFVSVRNIITEDLPSLKEQREFQVDLDKLETRVLRKLERFVNNRSTWGAKYSRAMSVRRQRTLHTGEHQDAADDQTGTQNPDHTDLAGGVEQLPKPRRANGGEDDMEEDSESDFFYDFEKDAEDRHKEKKAAAAAAKED